MLLRYHPDHVTYYSSTLNMQDWPNLTDLMKTQKRFDGTPLCSRVLESGPQGSRSVARHAPRLCMNILIPRRCDSLLIRPKPARRGTRGNSDACFHYLHGVRLWPQRDQFRCKAALPLRSTRGKRICDTDIESFLSRLSIASLLTVYLLKHSNGLCYSRSESTCHGGNRRLYAHKLVVSMKGLLIRSTI